jgi:hypothetical protein
MRIKDLWLRTQGCAIGLALTGLVISGCDSSKEEEEDRDPKLEDVKNQAGKTLNTTGRYLEGRYMEWKDAAFDTKENLKEQGEEALEEFDDSWREFNDSLKDLGEESKEKGAETAQKLEQLRREAGAKLEELGESSAEGWDTVRDGFVTAYDELAEALAEAKAEFNSDRN